MSEDHVQHPNYLKIWAVLIGLVVVSVVGSLVGIRAVTLITAFGVACIQAYVVAKKCMRIDATRRFVPYIVATVLVFMLLFFAGAAPDVMKAEGVNWVKPAWQDTAVERGSSLGEAHP